MVQGTALGNINSNDGVGFTEQGRWIKDGEKRNMEMSEDAQM